MDKKLVSIIMPMYNVGSYLRATMDSIVGQSYDKLEIIIIDDCSTDNSCSIVESYCSNYNNIKLIKLENNGGQSRARNIAMKHAHGGYIYFMDSDDILPSDAISTLVREISEGDYDFVIGEVRTLGIENEKLYSTHCDAPEIYSNNADIVKRYTQKGWCVAPWAKLFSKCFLDEFKIQFKEGIILEDELFTFTYVYKARKAKIIPYVVYDYYVRGNSTMTQKLSEKHLKGMQGDVEGMISVLSGNFKSPMTQRVIIMAYRLAETVLLGKFSNEIRTQYIENLSKEITPTIPFHSFRYGIKNAIKAFMFLLPSNYWLLYIKIIRRG